MKKVFLILSSALVIVSCNKPVATEQTVTADSLFICVLQSIFDSTRSCVEAKDEFIMFFDTMQSHVQSHPDYEIRVGAKSLAMELAGIMLESDLCSPEEVQFFCEELLARYVNIQSTWYLNDYAVEDLGKKKVLLLTQDIVFRYGEENRNYVITMDLYSLSGGQEMMVITLPEEAQSLASIVFHNEDMTDIDDSIRFDYTNAIQVWQRTEENLEMIFFGNDLIDAMLSHHGMYIAYIGNEETDDIYERYHDCHLMLDKFHEQYKSLKR